MKNLENIIGGIVFVPLALVLFMVIGFYQLYSFGKFFFYSLIGKENKY